MTHDIIDHVGTVGVATLALATASGALASAMISTAVAVVAFRAVRKESIATRAAVRQEEIETRAAVAQLTKTVEASSQAWYWTPEWQSGEDEADADIEAGRVVTAGSLEDLNSLLDDAAQEHPLGLGRV
jgi:hypothetical protein